MQKKPCVSIVVAIGNNHLHNRVIGKNNELIWHIPEDLRRFKHLTMGHPVIMGRKTFESILDILRKPLPDRTNIIVTRNKEYTAKDCIISHSVKEALEEAQKIDEEEIFVIGGGQMYMQALPFVDRLYLTLVDSNKDGDSFFPDYKAFTKKTFEQENMHRDLRYKWINLERE